MQIIGAIVCVLLPLLILAFELRKPDMGDKENALRCIQMARALMEDTVIRVEHDTTLIHILHNTIGTSIYIDSAFHFMGNSKMKIDLLDPNSMILDRRNDP